jgi:hypothetical protein
MAERFHLPIAMWRVQIDLLGGPRRLLAIALGYGMLLTIGAFGLHALYRSQPLSVFAAVAQNWVAAFQGFVLLLGGCNATYRAMLRDYETRMLESHRLTPMSNVSIPLGYLFGANAQTLTLAVVGFIIGAALGFLGSLPIIAWISGNLMVLCAAVMIWSIVVFSGLRPAKPISPSPFVMVTSMLTMGILFVPGAGVFCGTYAVYLAVGLISGTATFNAPSVLMIAGVSIGLALFWLYLAAVKYRRPDLPALNGIRGLFLFGVWTIVGTLGLVGFGFVSRRMLGELGMGSIATVQWIATALISMFVALVPISGAVQCRLLIERGTAPRDSTDRMPDMLAAVIAALMLLASMSTVGLPIWEELPLSNRLRIGFLSTEASAWLYTAVAVICGLFTIRGLMVMLYARMKKPVSWLFAFLMLLWVVPVIVDLALAGIRTGMERIEDLTLLTGMSPLGMILVTWSGGFVPLLPGVGAQVLLAGLFTLGARRVRASRYLAGHCMRCGYNLKGNTTNRCPECGTEC